MKLDDVGAAGPGLRLHGLSGSQQYRPGQGEHPRAGAEDRQGAELPARHPRPDAGRPEEPHPGPDRLQPAEPVLPRHLPGHGVGRQAARLRGRGREHRLPSPAARLVRALDAGPSTRGPGRDRLREGAGGHRGAHREQRSGRVLRRRRSRAERHRTSGPTTFAGRRGWWSTCTRWGIAAWRSWGTTSSCSRSTTGRSRS